MNKIIKDPYHIKNPFQKAILFKDKNDKYDTEWLLKNNNTHFHKLLNAVENILEIQNELSKGRNTSLNIFSAFSICTLLEYYYIKKSTIIDLLDIFYINYFQLKINKKDIANEIEKDMNLYLNNNINTYSEYRNRFKESFIDIRNRLIHDKGYSTKVFKMEDNILTFEISDSNNDTIIKNLDSVYSYYDYSSLVYENISENEKETNITLKHTPLIILSNYLVLNFSAFIEYIEIIMDLILKKDDICIDEQNSIIKSLYESAEYNFSLIDAVNNKKETPLALFQDKLNEIEILMNDKNRWYLEFS